MSKRSERRQRAALYESVTRRAMPVVDADSDSEREATDGHGDAPVGDDILARSPALASLVPASDGRRELPKMKKFRFQLLHQWMTARLSPCRIADVGGGKGLLAYLLARSGWSATVVDPIAQPLPSKYRDLASDRQMKISPDAAIPRIDAPFRPEMAVDFDLLVAMHAHGCNIQLLDAAAEHGRDVILLPCCIIHEPIIPPPGVHWLECVVEQATRRGFLVEPFRLNFKGQNIGLHARRP